MPVPREKAEELDQEVAVPWAHHDELRVHRIIREARRLLAVVDPDTQALLHDVLGRAYSRLNEVDQAEAEFTASLSIQESAPSWGNLGVLYLKTDRPEEALDALLRASDLGLCGPPLLTNLAEALWLSDQHEAAGAFLRDALASIDPARPEHLWRAASTASVLEEHQLAVELFARFNALRLGRSLGEFDPLTFIDSMTDEETEHLHLHGELLASLEYVRGIQEARLDLGAVPLLADASPWDEERERVLEEMAPLRARAFLERQNG